jgi:hypothetical protein
MKMIHAVVKADSTFAETHAELAKLLADARKSSYKQHAEAALAFCRATPWLKRRSSRESWRRPDMRKISLWRIAP